MFKLENTYVMPFWDANLFVPKPNLYQMHLSGY